MGRKVDVDDIIGAAEVAEILGLSHSESVGTYGRRYRDFPEPMKVLKGSKIWSRAAVEGWRERHPGRPRRS